MGLETGELNKEEGKVPQEGLSELMALFREQKSKIEDLEEKLKGKLTPGMDAGSLTDVITQVLKAVKHADKSEINHMKGGIQKEQIPLDDWDEKGTVFCAPYFGYVMSDYYYRGHPISPPYGMGAIFFEHKSARTKKYGKETQIFHTSMYVSHSKAVTSWLKSSPQYNVYFYENQKVMDSHDVRNAVRTAQLMNIIRDWDAPRVLKMCTQYDVPKHDDLEIMKNQLLMAMIDKENAVNGKIAKNAATNYDKEKMLLESNKDSFGA